MSSRRIDNPGIEINEIDRSQYDKVDYSLPNAPAVFTYGFADKGEDCALTWINSKTTLVDTYGSPTNECESYFYNSMYEVLNRGGTCIAAKLPYVNDSTNKYNYVDFKLSENLLSTYGYIGLDYIPNFNTLYEISATVYDVLSIGFQNTLFQKWKEQLVTVMNIVEAVKEMLTEASISPDAGTIDDIDTLYEIKAVLQKLITQYYKLTPFSLLYLNDSTLTSYISISNKGSGKDSIEHFDDYLTNRQKVNTNTIRIYDVTRSQYESLDSYDGCVVENDISTGNCLGIVPVIVTPANAMYFQQLLNIDLIDQSNKIKSFFSYNPISSFSSEYHKNYDEHEVDLKFSFLDQYLTMPLASEQDKIKIANSDGSEYESLSRRASLAFPQIQFLSPSRYDPTHLKDIGVVVFKAIKDVDNNGKMSFQLLESFIGSLDRTARDPITKANMFIDDVVNSRSKYIKLFSNANQKNIEKASTIIASGLQAISLGFYAIDCEKKISYTDSIIKPLTYILDAASNKHTMPIDIVVDAGVSNIANMANKFSGSFNADDYTTMAELNSNSPFTNISGWKTVVTKVDNFCKYTRKDCMFLVDGLRDMCLDGNVKYIRKTKPENTVANTIIPRFKYIANALNSSYSAGYCNWFYQQDYSDPSHTTYIWIPPSIKAAGVYIYCDTYFHPWSAPAGQVRGIIRDAVDVAFIPLDDDAGKIYGNQWNYAMSYPMDGITIEGHKTFQIQKTALDRVNVRRLLLYLEKRVERIARRFVYENNTAYTRQLFVDSIRQVFEDAVAGDGVKEYGIKCDDELNTVDVIENNELRCKIVIKPVKCVDYIVLDFICTRQNASISEELVR